MESIAAGAPTLERDTGDRSEDLSGDTGLVWKVVRKLLRFGVEAPYGKVASYLGAAPSFQAVFQKGQDITQ